MPPFGQGAQRNTSVVQASPPAEIDLNPSLGYRPSPADAVVDVEADSPGAAERLQLLTGRTEPGYVPPPHAPTAGFLPPAPVSSRASALRRLPWESVGT